MMCAILVDFKIPKYVVMNSIEFSSIILTTEFFGYVERFCATDDDI